MSVRGTSGYPKLLRVCMRPRSRASREFVRQSAQHARTRTCQQIDISGIGLYREMEMSKIITDKFGERTEAGPNDSSEEEKEIRRGINRGKP